VNTLYPRLPAAAGSPNPESRSSSAPQNNSNRFPAQIKKNNVQAVIDNSQSRSILKSLPCFRSRFATRAGTRPHPRRMISALSSSSCSLPISLLHRASRTKHLAEHRSRRFIQNQFIHNQSGAVSYGISFGKWKCV
jgi:hypothetical protein